MKNLNSIHGSSHLIPKGLHDEHNPMVPYNLLEINKRMMGGGMSQNYAALYFFEHYIANYQFEYVLEIGTQKGAFSLYLANMANVTEKFYFHTADISTKDYYCRETEGVGHWLDKINLLSDYSHFFNVDIFDTSIAFYADFIAKFKTLIFCDGGDKAREFRMFAPMLKSGDHIILHDWGHEVFQNQIEESMKENEIFFNEPYVNSCYLNATLLMPFFKL
jgi:hypothetical protein